MSHHPDDTPVFFSIRAQGHLPARWSAWFDDLAVTADTDGTTVISGPVADQSALHGVLNKLRDLGIPLLDVTRIPPTTPDPTTPDTQHSYHRKELS